MIRTVVARAAADGHRQTIGAIVVHDQQISRSLGGRMRTASMNRSLLGEEQVGANQQQVTIHLISGHLMITQHSILTASVHQSGSSHHIGPKENTGLLNGTVNMTLCRKIDHQIGLANVLPQTVYKQLLDRKYRL